jgi:hypothetical protein
MADDMNAGAMRTLGEENAHQGSFHELHHLHLGEPTLSECSSCAASISSNTMVGATSRLTSSSSSPLSIPRRCAIVEIVCAIFVNSCSASRLICRSRSARLSAAAAMRFWLMRMKVDRKIASTDHGQHHKRLVPWSHTGHPAEIRNDPEPKRRKVKAHEPHTAGEGGDRVRKPRIPTGRGCLSRPALGKAANIPLQNGSESFGWRRLVSGILHVLAPSQRSSTSLLRCEWATACIIRGSGIRRSPLFPLVPGWRIVKVTARRPGLWRLRRMPESSQLFRDVHHGPQPATAYLFHELSFAPPSVVIMRSTRLLDSRSTPVSPRNRSPESTWAINTSLTFAVCCAPQ